MTQLGGIHHVTAIATDPQRNVDFYLQTLGLRLLKQTVNFDAPDVYHLYYGDEAGTPGTILTFFPWPGSASGRRGTGQATSTSFSVPESSIGWWHDRLAGLGVDVGRVATRAGEAALALRDPDGLVVELVAHPEADPRPPWEQGPVPPEHAIRGLHSVVLTESGFDDTASLLTGTLGFDLVEEDARAARYRFAVAGGGPGALVDVMCSPESEPGLVAAGTVHHVAWRTPDDDGQVCVAQRLGGPGPERDADHRPAVLPLDLLPRAGRGAVRDRHRSAGVHDRRAAARAGPAAAAAAVAGTAAGGDRGHAAPVAVAGSGR